MKKEFGVRPRCLHELSFLCDGKCSTENHSKLCTNNVINDTSTITTIISSWNISQHSVPASVPSMTSNIIIIIINIITTTLGCHWAQSTFPGHIICRKTLLANMATNGIPTSYIRCVRGFLWNMKMSVLWQGAYAKNCTFLKPFCRCQSSHLFFGWSTWTTCLKLPHQPPLSFAFADDTTFVAQCSSLTDCKSSLQPAGLGHGHRWPWPWLSLSHTKSTVLLFSRYISEGIRLSLKLHRDWWVSWKATCVISESLVLHVHTVHCCLLCIIKQVINIWPESHEIRSSTSSWCPHQHRLYKVNTHVCSSLRSWLRIFVGPRWNWCSYTTAPQDQQYTPITEAVRRPEKTSIWGKVMQHTRIQVHHPRIRRSWLERSRGSFQKGWPWHSCHRSFSSCPPPGTDHSRIHFWPDINNYHQTWPQQAIWANLQISNNSRCLRSFLERSNR